jgi:hypothetical protein
MYIVRQSEHISEDITRNWSSFNYGELGFEGTRKELEEAMNEAIKNESSFDISGFELWEDEIKNSNISELYSNYFVLVDNTRGTGLSCNILESDSLEEAIEEAIEEVELNGVDLGEGETVDCTNATVVWSDSEDFVHILEIED